MNEELRKEIIMPDKEFKYDEMEDETGMNTIEECEGGMASLGAAPTPNVSNSSLVKVNGVPVQGKGHKKNKKSLRECIDELNEVLKSI